jgi:hypothetical protein
MNMKLDSATAIREGMRFARAKTLVATGLFFGVAAVAFAGGGGGEVDFENFSNSLIYTNSMHDGPATGLITGDHAYYFMLLSAETNTTTIDATLGGGRPLDQGGWSPETQGLHLGTNTTTAGLMNGNYLFGPATDVSDGPGEQRNYAVVGWSANIGNDWLNQVLPWWNDGNPTSGPSGFFGISDVAQDVVIGGGGYPIPTIFGPTPGYEIQGFTLNLYDVPEPTAFVLAAFGIVALFIMRRLSEGDAAKTLASPVSGLSRRENGLES